MTQCHKFSIQEIHSRIHTKKGAFSHLSFFRRPTVEPLSMIVFYYFKEGKKVIGILDHISKMT